jgi:hypothetical protein
MSQGNGRKAPGLISTPVVPHVPALVSRPTTRSGRRFAPMEARVRVAVERLRELADRQGDLDRARERRRLACLLADWEDLAADLRDAEVMAEILLRDICRERQLAEAAVQRLNISYSGSPV